MNDVGMMAALINRILDLTEQYRDMMVNRIELSSTLERRDNEIRELEGSLEVLESRIRVLETPTEDTNG